MAKRQTDQWGIRFGISVNGSGYAWCDQAFHEVKPMLLAGRLPDPKMVLGPAGQIEARGDGGYAVMARDVQKRRDGLDIARQAFSGFSSLAARITSSRPNDEEIRKSAGQTMVISGGFYQMPVMSQEQMQEEIRDFANKFGALWGDNDPRPIEDWRKEAASFLDLLDVAKALKSADFREFESRIVDHDDGFGVRYSTRRLGARSEAIARPGEIIEERAAPNALKTTIDFYELARTGSSRGKARIHLSRQINAKLAGGLSLRASMISEKADVEPRHLIHLLYMRLWLTTVNAEEIEREMTCLECHAPITGTRRKKFCDAECRTRFNNRKRATLLG